MPNKSASSRLALDQRTARIEQVAQSAARRLGQIPLRRWQFVVLLLLVIWLSHSLARLFWMLVPPPELAPAAVSLVQGTTSTGSDRLTGVDILDLKSLDLFGPAPQLDQTVENLPPPIEETDTTVDTQLSLVLLGVVPSNAEEAGRAIISANGQQDVYAPGAELPVGQNVTLTRVLDQRVILNNNGRLESLWLHQEGSAGNQRLSAATRYAAPEPMTSRSWSEENDYVQTEDQPPPQFVDRSPMPEMGQGSAGESEVAAEISRNISDVVAMSIHREGGQVVGYKIRPGRNAEQFASLGLQPDDIVTAVNGVPLNNPGKIMEIYRNMSNATSASLEIKRGGSVISVDIVLQ